jgi:ribose transport system substrate-binding protein
METSHPNVVRPAFAFLLLAALLLSGCQGAATPTAAVAPTQAAPVDFVAQYSTDYIAQGLVSASGETIDTAAFKKDPPYKITWILWGLDNSFNVQQNAEVVDEASKYPESVISEFTALEAKGDANTQIAMMEDAITRGVDAIIVDPIDQSALAAVAEKAKAAGIIVIDGNDLLESTGVTSSVLNDEVRFGREISNWLINKLQCKGKIIELNGMTGNSSSDMREAGLTNAIKACPDGGAGITILSKVDALWAYDQGKTATAQMLAAFPEIDGVWSQGGAMTQGAIDAFIAAGRPLVPMTGENNNGFLLAWAAHQSEGFDAVAATTPTWMSRLGVQVALKALQGIPIDRNYLAAGPIITSENLSQYLFPDYNDSYWAGSLLPQAKLDEMFKNK